MKASTVAKYLELFAWLVSADDGKGLCRCGGYAILNMAKLKQHAETMKHKNWEAAAASSQKVDKMAKDAADDAVQIRDTRLVNVARAAACSRRLTAPWCRSRSATRL